MLKIERRAGLGLYKRLQALFEIDCRFAVNLLDIEREHALWMNDLHHLIVVQTKRGSQGLVACLQCLEARA